MTQPSDTERSESRSDAILDAAEQVFAQSGFKGATMREIAELAGVAQALIHYHYKNKETLFTQLVARRSVQINGHRIALLDALLAGKDQPDLEHIVEALFRPTIETGLDLARDGGAFARLLVSFANSSDPRDQGILETHYDPVALRFIAAFQQVESNLTRADAVWAYMFAIGVGMTMMAKTGRSARLSDGECDDGDVEAMLARIVPFICAGVRALKT